MVVQGNMAAGGPQAKPSRERRGLSCQPAAANAGGGRTAPLAPPRRSAYYKAALLGRESLPLPTVFILNGPNLNLLGVREPAVYGRGTLADIEARCQARAQTLGLEIVFHQTNHEGQLVDWIQQARETADGIVLNAGALTHTSVAILDALSAAGLPVIEVHLSNIFRRERFRHHSYVSLAASGVICGLGAHGYELALEALANLIVNRSGEGGQ